MFLRGGVTTDSTERTLPEVRRAGRGHSYPTDPDLTHGAIINALMQIIAVHAAQSTDDAATVDRQMHVVLDGHLNAARLAVSKEGGAA